jgi:hypothetical protein
MRSIFPLMTAYGTKRSLVGQADRNMQIGAGSCPSLKCRAVGSSCHPGREGLTERVNSEVDAVRYRQGANMVRKRASHRLMSRSMTSPSVAFGGRCDESMGTIDQPLPKHGRRS